MQEVSSKSDKGKSEETEVAGPEAVTSQKTFLEKLNDFLNKLMAVKGYAKDDGLINFKKLIQAAETRKNPVDKDKLENAMKDSLLVFYNRYRDSIVDGNLEFLTKKDVINDDNSRITVGSRGASNIALAKIYTQAHESNPEVIVDIEANFFFLMEIVCPDDDLDAIGEICSQFETKEIEVPSFGSGGGFLGSIGKMLNKITSKTNEGGFVDSESGELQLNRQTIKKFFNEMMDDEDVGQTVDEVFNRDNLENFDQKEVTNGLFKMVNGLQGANK